MVRLYWDLSLSGRHVHELRPGDERHGRRARHQDRRQDQVDEDRIAVPAMSARGSLAYAIAFAVFVAIALPLDRSTSLDRKSTRLNSSHLVISYAVFCLKKKTT